MKRLSLLVLVVAVATAGTVSAQTSSTSKNVPCYKVTDLGPAIPGAYDLNATGTVVGQTERWNATLRGFVYVQQKISPLPALGGTTSSAQGVNNRGQIVGSASSSDGTTHPVIWQGEKTIDLGLLGGTWGIAADINDNGDVVSCIDGRVVAWIWGRPLDLAIPNASFMWPTGINNEGEISALVMFADNLNHAYLYRDSAWISIDTPGGSAFPADINERGEVCGGGGFQNGYHAFIYNGKSWTDLDPTSKWSWSTCSGLNDRGHAVGTFGTPLGDHAFVRRNAKEGMLDLNDLIQPVSGLTLVAASKINGRGQIAAYASTADGTHAVLLSRIQCK